MHIYTSVIPLQTNSIKCNFGKLLHIRVIPEFFHSLTEKLSENLIMYTNYILIE